MTTASGFRSRATVRPLVSTGVATVLALLLAACGAGNADNVQETPQSTPRAQAAEADPVVDDVDEPEPAVEELEPTPEEPELAVEEPVASTADLCDRAAALLVVVERPFVGSDEHVAQFTALAEVAPERMLADIALLKAHFRDDVTPANPDSQDFVNFPPDVQDAAVALDTELRALCG